MKRITEMRERKKMETSGLEVHQTMMGMFGERFNFASFGQGFESSESLTVHSSENDTSNEERQHFFDDIRRMKNHVSFDTSANHIHFESVPDEEKFSLNRTRTRLPPSTTSRVNQSEAKERVKLTVSLMQSRTEAEDRESLASSVEPVE